MVTFLFPAFQPCGHRINEKVNEKLYNERHFFTQSIIPVHALKKGTDSLAGSVVIGQREMISDLKTGC